MVYTGLLEVADVVANDTQVHVSEEFTGDVGNFFVLDVVLHSIVIVSRIDLTQLHVVDTDAVVSKCLTVHIANGPADLQELLILGNGLFELSKVVFEDTGGVVGATLVSALTSTLAGESKDLIVLEPLLGCDTVIRVSIGHRQA